jgi:hypothetical protein
MKQKDKEGEEWARKRKGNGKEAEKRKIFLRL